MKISIDIDCTPEEARRFFGLPDFTPLHETFVSELQTHMQKAMTGMNAEQLVKTWMPGGGGWDQMQKYWQEMMTSAAQKPKKDPGA